MAKFFCFFGFLDDLSNIRIKIYIKIFFSRIRLKKNKKTKFLGGDKLHARFC